LVKWLLKLDPVVEAHGPPRYFMAGTSFGHLTTNDTFPPPGGYKLINGTIFDLLDQNQVTWLDYFQDAPQGGSFRLFSPPNLDPHFVPLTVFFAQAAAGTLPQVSFVDPNFGLLGTASENDEHPPTDIQRGQAFSQVITMKAARPPRIVTSAPPAATRL